MSSIYLMAARFINQGTREQDQHHKIPLLVFNRGLFDCMAPRLEKLLPPADGGTSWRTHRIAANSCTYHLTQTVSFAVQSDMAPASTTMQKFSQVKDLTLRARIGRTQLPSGLSPAIQNFASTLTVLVISCVSASSTGNFSDLFASAILVLRNLEALTIPRLTPDICKAVAAGPGQQLKELQTGSFDCEPADVDVVVARCPNIWALRVADTTRNFELVVAASKLQYLQTLNIRGSPLDTDMHTAFSNMACLTKLDFSGDLTATSASIIATTVGPRLSSLRLNVAFCSESFATICCASSFPQLEHLELRSMVEPIISDGVTVSLPPSLKQLTLLRFDVALRTLTQLLKNKSQLEDVRLEVSATRRRARNNDDNSAAPTATATDEDDWFSELVKSPLKKLILSPSAVSPLVSRRLGQLASKLVAVTFTGGPLFP